MEENETREVEFDGTIVTIEQIDDTSRETGYIVSDVDEPVEEEIYIRGEGENLNYGFEIPADAEYSVTETGGRFQVTYHPEDDISDMADAGNAFGSEWFDENMVEVYVDSIEYTTH